VIKHKENKKINIMRSIPVTTRLKRVPAKKAIAKLTEDEIKQMTPKASIVNEGEDKETIENKLGYSGKNQKLTQEQSDWKNKKIKELGSVQAYRDKYKIGKQKVVGQKKVETKGEDTLVPTYSKREGTISDNFDDRQLGRKTKFKNKLVRQSGNKLARAEDRMAKFEKKYSKAGVDKEGNPTSTFAAPKAGEKGYRKYKKLQNKVTENTNELADFEASSDNQAEAMRSGKKISQTFRRDEDRRDTAGDQSPGERKRQVAAENKIITQSIKSSDRAIDPESGQGITMNPSAYKMKPKSPATKKLQGSQNKLPMQLQNAIKAAPDKSRTSFKMKGYGKK